MSHTHEVNVVFKTYSLDSQHAREQIQAYINCLRLTGVDITTVTAVSPVVPQAKENGDEPPPSD